MNGHRARNLRREVTRHGIGRPVRERGELKVTVKTERVNERGELENIVESASGIMDCGHVSDAPGGACRCGRLLCPDCSKSVCSACSVVICERCKVVDKNRKAVYHFGWCRVSSFVFGLLKR